MSKDSTEIQKELEKAATFENEGNLDKAARSYFKVANLLAEEEQSIKLFNKAFFTARKSGNTDLMYKFGKAYYEILLHWNQQKKIEELVPTFIEISGRKKDQLVENKSSEEIDDLFEWMIDLYQLTGNVDAAYDVSQQAGEVISSVGYHYLSGSYLIGKEEKWNRGLELLDNAISAYQQIRLDKKALQNIIDVKLNKIGYLIDIGRYNEGMEEKSNLIGFHSSQTDELRPYSQKDLSAKIADIFSEKCISITEIKKFDLSDDLLKVAKTEYEKAGEYSKIPPFLWKMALIYEEKNLKKLFFNLLDDAFNNAKQYEDKEIQNAIIEHLESQGIKNCNNIISSRRLMIQKGPIEFQQSEGVQYLLEVIGIAKKYNMPDKISSILDFLYQYAQEMYAKKLVNRSLPYFNFIAQTWFDIPDGITHAHIIVKFLETRLNEILATGKFDAGAAHLGIIISIKSYIGEAESAGDSAFSFAKSAASQGKQDVEIEFLKKACDAYTNINAKSKLKELLDHIIQQSDAAFVSKTKYAEYRDRLLDIGNVASSQISLETQGEFLQATTFKAFNSDLIELGVNTAAKTFEIQKQYDQQLAADFYFKIGKILLNIDNERALDYINKSLEFASQFENLQSAIQRNLDFLMEETLKIQNLTQKIVYVNNLDVITANIKQRGTFLEFLIQLIKNLAEKAQNPDYFNEMKKFLSLSFNEYYNLDNNHVKLQEIIDFTNQFTVENYSPENFSQIYELSLLNLAFHEKLKDTEHYLVFFWDIFEKLADTENLSHALNLYKQTSQFLNRLETPQNIKQDLTEKVVFSLNRSIKSKIIDEKYDESWNFLQDLYEILKNNKLDEQAVTLYRSNAEYFAEKRLDISLSMWVQAIAIAKSIKDSESLSIISNTIVNDIIPIYVKREILPAVNQLYSQAIDAKQAIGDGENLLSLYIEAMKISLSLAEIDNLQKWGSEGFKLAIENKVEKALFEFADMYFGVGRGLLSDNPEVAIKLINNASNSLRDYGDSGYDYYCVKMSEIYEDLYNSSQTTEFAQKEREKILSHFKRTNNLKEEGKFLITTAKLGFQAENIREGLELISKATKIFQELEDSEGLSEIVSVCLKNAAHYTVGSNEYEMLSRQATIIQESGTAEIDESKTQEAFTDLFDGLLDDMTELMDPRKRKEKQKKK